MGVDRLAGGLECALCVSREPCSDKRLGHLVEQLELILAQDALALVIRQLDSVGVRDMHGIGGVLVEHKCQIGVFALFDGCGQFGAVFLDAGGRTRLRYVHGFALIYVLVGIKGLGHKAVLCKEQPHDRREPDFFLYCHFFG